MQSFERNFWVLITPAQDAPGQWLGHCLELDIVSVGTSLRHAIAMTVEAVCETVADDLANGRSPLDRTPAPAEFFSELSRVQSRGTYGALEDVPDRPVIAACQLHVAMSPPIALHAPQRLQPIALPASQRPVEELPPAWFMAKQNADARLGA